MRRAFDIFFVFIIGLFISSSFAHAQCGSVAEEIVCISKLQEGFTFLKCFNVDGQNGAKPKVEYAYVFSKGTQYYINICSEGTTTDGIIMTIYDSDRNKVTTNFKDGECYPELIYKCKSSDIYYLTFTFRDFQHYCGGSVLGFRR
jgi:outer membrane lipoprotein-sorting protein